MSPPSGQRKNWLRPHQPLLKDPLCEVVGWASFSTPYTCRTKGGASCTPLKLRPGGAYQYIVELQADKNQENALNLISFTFFDLPKFTKQRPQGTIQLALKEICYPDVCEGTTNP